MIKYKNQVIVTRLLIADTFLKRLKGLMFTKAIPRGQALLITPCNGIHTWFMNYPIDVVLCDYRGTILKCVPNVSPWRLGPYQKNAHFVIEMPANSINEYGLVVGEWLEVNIPGGR